MTEKRYLLKYVQYESSNDIMILIGLDRIW